MPSASSPPSLAPLSVDPAGASLLRALRQAKNSGKLVRSTDHQYHGHAVTSWKMAEYAYKKQPCPFPTLARGLFSVPEGKDERIAVRGYDKFFNVGEVSWTEWDNLEHYTSGPYSLTYKENGCIIFISALSPTDLVVTSKHALGPPNAQNAAEGQNESHAEVGERWLDTHLAAKGRTKEQLAKVLWESGRTAVAELCDDAFEEHVLAYPPDRRGLHLHGLNHNTAGFQTEPFPVVQAFAKEWGFIKTRSRFFTSLGAVREYAAKIEREGGAIDGEAIEGFVVRCHVADKAPSDGAPSSGNGTVGKGGPAAPPYPVGAPFFFKVKFDEPYLMYREWRELTRDLISSAAKGQPARMRPTYPDSVLYVEWTRDQLKRDPKAYEGFNRGRGIIAARERFLRYTETTGGAQRLKEFKEGWKGKAKGFKARTTELDEKAQDTRPFEKTLIVPIAIPGCGKTAIGIALSHLFGFGHTQSDDVATKKTAAGFETNVKNLLRTNDVVFADRNNHLLQHRSALAGLPGKAKPPLPRTRVVAMHWSTTALPRYAIHRICADRIVSRGERHQSLRAEPGGGKDYEEILHRFLGQVEEFDADAEGFDGVIEMDVEEDLEAGLRRAVDGLRAVLSDLREIPDAEVRAALEAVRAYNPSLRKAAQASGALTKAPRYFALAVEASIPTLVPSILDAIALDPDAEQPHAAAREFFDLLRDAKRANAPPHVTLVHEKEVAAEGDKPGAKAALWDHCKALADRVTPPSYAFDVPAIVWNDRVMALVGADLELVDEGRKDDKDAEDVPGLVGGKVLHVTIGTRDAEIAPVEAKELVEAWRKEGTSGALASSGVRVVECENVRLRGRVRGMW